MRKGFGILLFFDLCKGFIGGLVQFELKDIDVIFGLYEHIQAPVGSVAFHVDIEAEHLENDIHHVVEIYIDAIEAAKEVAGDLLADHVLQLVIVAL